MDKLKIMNINVLKKLVLILLISVFVLNAYSQNNTEKRKVIVNVDCSVEQGKFRRSELYNNISSIRLPRNEVFNKYFETMGRTKIMRYWLKIDHYWDYKNDTYNYNYPVGYGFNLWGKYYESLEQISDISEEILLNVRGNHELVVSGEITMEKWREVCKSGIKHYKVLFPKIKYIEALNEYSGSPFGGLTNDEYYLFYKEFYEIVNEINAEIKPEIPLLVGGPCIMGGSLNSDAPKSKRTKMLAFLENYSKDTSTKKRIDFLSYHQYNDSKVDPSSVQNHGELIDAWMTEYNITPKVPVFINEMGCFSGSDTKGCIEDDVLVTACNIASLFYFYNQQENLQGFHWVMQHSINDRKTQILDDFRWTPYGISMLMMKRHKNIKILVDSNGLKNGQGIYSIASKNDSTVVLQIWNYQWLNNNDFNVQININNLNDCFRKEKALMKLYLLDKENNNFLVSNNHYSKSATDNDMIVAKSDTVQNLSDFKTNIHLHPNSMVLLELKVLGQQIKNNSK